MSDRFLTLWYIILESKKNVKTYLEHVLSEYFFIFLSELLVNSFAKLREVDEAILDNVVGQVNYLLLHRVQPQHLHGSKQVLKIKINDKVSIHTNMGT